jgi:radical SAM protein with 4Fe4S-binding SPASM domain
MNYLEEISWVDEYVSNVADFISVREADNLLIKIPNEAYKLNPQAVKILKEMLSGTKVISIIGRYPDQEKAAADIHDFFCDMRAVLKGCYHEQQERRSIEKIPFSLPHNELPVLSEIAVTYRCNLLCKFCYASCGCRRDDQPRELDTAELKEVLSIIRNEAEVPSVSFTGGEPIMREDLPELVAHAKSLRMWTNLITNATLITPEIAERLKSSGLDSAQVSLEAGQAGLHDSIVGQEGAFEATIAGLKDLIAAGIRVHTNTTISNLNKDHLSGIVDLVKELGLTKFSMNMLMPAGRAIVNLKEVSITYSRIGDIVLAVQKHALDQGLEFMWYSPTPVCIFNPIIHGLGNKGCAACDGLLSIAPNGDILPCSSYPRAMANILRKKGSFKKTWQGPGFKFFQQKRFAHKRCRECAYLAFCNGGCPLYWSKFGDRELACKPEEALA